MPSLRYSIVLHKVEKEIRSPYGRERVKVMIVPLDGYMGSCNAVVKEVRSFIKTWHLLIRGKTVVLHEDRCYLGSLFPRSKTAGHEWLDDHDHLMVVDTLRNLYGQKWHHKFIGNVDVWELGKVYPHRRTGDEDDEYEYVREHVLVVEVQVDHSSWIPYAW